ncbi:hypothetical protein DEO23_12200 [Brachybacterium endophyticum]|uniref:Uncharacterized protein n=1 Tax=Brachybacterium endophyticum TaxID=2182385 RepID=A0A2U2RHM0_9MICO|nr:hypothetical protein [Brachybacterium endophyticum]PWH05348.1 hypothetical protein DEO23_12200 [Brachybacterium endophyticum]
MSRTLRTLAVPLAAMLMLAGCGNTEESASEPTAQAQQSDGGGVSESDGGGSTAPMDDGGDGSEEADCAPEDFDEVEGMCAGEETALGAPQGDLFSQGQFTVIGYTNYLLTVPADCPEDIVAFVKDAGGDPVECIKVDVDNAQGSEAANVQAAALVSGEGEQFEYEVAWNALDELTPALLDDGPTDVNDGYYYTLADGTEISEDEYDALNNQAADVNDKYMTDDVRPTAKGVEWLVGPAAPEKMSYVELTDTVDTWEASPLE